MHSHIQERKPINSVPFFSFKFPFIPYSNPWDIMRISEKAFMDICYNFASRLTKRKKTTNIKNLPRENLVIALTQKIRSFLINSKRRHTEYNIPTKSLERTYLAACITKVIIPRLIQLGIIKDNIENEIIENLLSTAQYGAKIELPYFPIREN
ncbi:MAG: hypothetical protein JO131_03120, partial [Gammaproteobacteria bacterium]|nr:hypothetical protein [Gammaproteobacteria bacterium]